MGDGVRIPLLRSRWVLLLAFFVCMGAFLLWAASAPMLADHAQVLSIEPAQVIDDSGGEMALVTWALAVPTNALQPTFRWQGFKVEARVGKQWLRVPNAMV